MSDPYLSSINLRKRKITQFDADMRTLITCSDEQQQRKGVDEIEEYK